jgi:hypothetical protein
MVNMSCNEFGFTKQNSTLDAIQFVIEKAKQQIKRNYSYCSYH